MASHPLIPLPQELEIQENSDMQATASLLLLGPQEL